MTLRRAGLVAGLGSIGLVTRLCLGVVTGTGLVSCGGGGGGGDGPTAPSISCKDAQWSFIGGNQTPNISFVLGCSGGLDFTMSNALRDQFSRVTAYDYEYKCANGTQRNTGRVSNIQYNNLGQALSWDFTVNGTQCGRVTITP